MYKILKYKHITQRYISDNLYLCYKINHSMLDHITGKEIYKWKQRLYCFMIYICNMILYTFVNNQNSAK